MKTNPKPPCPRCGTAKQVVAANLSEDLFHCKKCGGLFDDDTRPGADGGDYYNDPTKRIEKETRRR